MPHRSRNRELLFLISDVGRLLRTYADQKARAFGMTRAQWAVLLRLERREGLKQSDLAEALDLQPITLTRLVDRLCDNGLIERRADPSDRRAKRLYLTAAARPLINRIADRIEELSETVLAASSRPRSTGCCRSSALRAKTSGRRSTAARRNSR
jgi:MarR family transcriptional regulator for hemolysin